MTPEEHEELVQKYQRTMTDFAAEYQQVGILSFEPKFGNENLRQMLRILDDAGAEVLPEMLVWAWRQLVEQNEAVIYLPPLHYATAGAVDKDLNGSVYVFRGHSQRFGEMFPAVFQPAQEPPPGEEPTRLPDPPSVEEGTWRTADARREPETVEERQRRLDREDAEKKAAEDRARREQEAFAAEVRSLTLEQYEFKMMHDRNWMARVNALPRHLIR